MYLDEASEKGYMVLVSTVKEHHFLFAGQIAPDS
jgi:hypothetical protein